MSDSGDGPYQKAEAANVKGVEQTAAKLFAESVLSFTFVIGQLNTEPCTTTRTIYQRNCALKAVSLANRSYSYLKLGKLEKALDDALAALQLPNPTPAHHLLHARIAFEMGQLKVCVKACEAVLAVEEAEEAHLQHAQKLKKRAENEIQFDEGTGAVVDMNFLDESDDEDELEDYWRPVAVKSKAAITFHPKHPDECRKNYGQYCEFVLDTVVLPSRRGTSALLSKWYESFVSLYLDACVALDDGGVSVDDARYASSCILESMHLLLLSAIDNGEGDTIAQFMSHVSSFGTECIPMRTEQHGMYWKQLCSKALTEGSRRAKSRQFTAQHRAVQTVLDLILQRRLGAMLPTPMLLVNTVGLVHFIPGIDASMREAPEGDWPTEMWEIPTDTTTVKSDDVTEKKFKETALATSMATLKRPLAVLNDLAAVVRNVRARDGHEAGESVLDTFITACVPPEMRSRFVGTLSAMLADSE